MPAMTEDGRWASATQFIAEPQTFWSQPNSRCNELFPLFRAPHLIAGGPLAGNVLECQRGPQLHVRTPEFTARARSSPGQRRRATKRSTTTALRKRRFFLHFLKGWLLGFSAYHKIPVYQ
jgi:hypothetical protein